MRRRAAAACVVLALLVCSGGAVFGEAEEQSEVSDVVRTHRLEIVDSKGAVRAVVGCTEGFEAAPVVLLYDAEGRVRVCLTSSSLADGLTVYDSQGQPRALVLLNEAVGPVVGVAAADSLASAGLYLPTEGPRLMVFDQSGQYRLILGLHGDASGVQVLDKSGVLRGQIALTQGTSTIDLFDSRGRPLFTAPSSGDQDEPERIIVPWPIFQDTRPPRPSGPIASPVPPGLYLRTGSRYKHWVQRTMDMGKHVTLEDGSMWEVAPLDRRHAALWLGTQRIVVNQSGNVTYPYSLHNQTTGETVKARLLSQ